MTAASGPGTATGGYNYGAGVAGPHAVTTAGSNTYSYDTAGNQTVRTVAGNAVQTLSYDVQNRLDTITENSTVVASYGYDADGVRTVVTNGGVTTFVIGEVYEVTPGTPTAERVSYRFGAQTVGYNDGTGLRVVAAGNLGSVEVEVTTAGVSTRQTYFPFGALRSSGTNNLGTDRTYTDQVDDGTGLMHYRARQYDPVLARFTQPDSIIPDASNSADFNRYTYVRNIPVNGTDPDGRETCAWVGGVYVCWEEVENIPGVRDPNTVCNSTVCTIAAPPNYLSDDPADWNLPEWVPSEVVVQAGRYGSELGAALRELDEILRMDLRDFAEIWESPADFDAWDADFRNDGCSDRNVFTGGSPGCIRHDFIYRNLSQIDDQYGLEGELLDNAQGLKDAADSKLSSDLGLRGPVAHFFLRFLGGSFYDPAKPLERNGSPYGDSRYVVRPPLNVR